MLFRKKIERQCIYCSHSTRLNDEQLHCPKKGIKKPEDHCMFFTYDPTKRVPTKAKAVDFEKYEEYDYSL
jgi:hypothetical protein